MKDFHAPQINFERLQQIDSGIIPDEEAEPVVSEADDDESAEGIKVESVKENTSDTKEDSSEESTDRVVVELAEKKDVQSSIPVAVDFVSEEESTEQTIPSDESTEEQEIDTDINSEEIVEQAIQNTLEEQPEKEEPIKADLKENEEKFWIGVFYHPSATPDLPPQPSQNANFGIFFRFW